MRINLPEDFYLLLLSILPKDIAVRLTNFVSLTRKSNSVYQQKYRKSYCKTDRKNVSLTVSESSEICSKTPFLAQNGDNSVTSRDGGVGGVGLDLNTSTYQHNDTLTHNDVKREVTLNQIYSKSENFSKNFSENKKAKWEKIKNEFQQYWIAYPTEGRQNWKECLYLFNKLRKEIPDVDFFHGLTSHYYQNVWKDFTPSLKTFLSNEEWKGLDTELKAKIERNREHYKAMLEKRIKLFNQGVKT